MPNCIFETSDHIMRDQSKQSVRQYCKLIGCAGIFYIFSIFATDDLQACCSAMTVCIRLDFVHVYMKFYIIIAVYR